jgi:hypothetical protein
MDVPRVCFGGVHRESTRRSSLEVSDVRSMTVRVSQSKLLAAGAYPSCKEVECAIQLQLCAWHRFLRKPLTNEEVTIQARIAARWLAAGGYAHWIDEELGWGED